MDEKVLFVEAVIDAPLAAVWQAWTTEAGARSFFAPACKIDLRPGGAYEMYFDLEAPLGSRGGEGCTILAVEGLKMLSFTWNAPPEFPAIRTQLTHVLLRFTEVDAGHTRVSLRQDGWGNSPEWQAVYRYFEGAWGQVVLPRLQQRFLAGPYQWQKTA